MLMLMIRFTYSHQNVYSTSGYYSITFKKNAAKGPQYFVKLHFDGSKFDFDVVVGAFQVCSALLMWW